MLAAGDCHENVKHHFLTYQNNVINYYEQIISCTKEKGNNLVQIYFLFELFSSSSFIQHLFYSNLNLK